MDNYEDMVEDDIKKLTEYEEYQMKIKQDLRQLSGEKNLLLEPLLKKKKETLPKKSLVG